MRTLLLTFCVLLSACSTSTYTKPVDRPKLDLPAPPAIKMDSIKFKVIHKHNADKYFNDADASGKEPVVVALPVSDYKKLAVNVVKLKAYIKAQQKIISLYKRYYESSKNGGQKEKN